MYEMSKKYPGLPKDMVSCPGCGREYGHHGTKVCHECQECSTCCMCSKDKKDFVEAAVFVSEITE